MPIYGVTIQQVIIWDVFVEADTMEQAQQIARDTFEEPEDERVLASEIDRESSWITLGHVHTGEVHLEDGVFMKGAPNAELGQ